jgi:mRNA interferase MazF
MDIGKYDEWNKKKQDLQFSDKTNKIYFKEGQIWWCSVGLNIGDESYGKGEGFYRPVLIIKKLSNNLCVCLPLTSKEKVGSWFVEIVLSNERNWVMLSQIKSISKKRFYLKMAELNPEDLFKIKEKLEQLLELSKNNHRNCFRIDG